MPRWQPCSPASTAWRNGHGSRCSCWSWTRPTTPSANASVTGWALSALASAPCRGQQLRQGAAQAQHSILWFLHADAQLLGNPLLGVQAVMSNGAVGGFFAFRFAGPSCWQSRVLEQLIGWRNRFGIPYGDQGLFVERSAYLACGQHSPWPLFEEVDLVNNLRGLGDFQCIEHGLLVDPRRWQRDGWWCRSLSNRLLALAHACGVSAFTLARLYPRGHSPTP